MLCNRTENRNSEPGKIGRRVRQGCLLSPILFSLCRNNDDRGDGRCGRRS